MIKDNVIIPITALIVFLVASCGSVETPPADHALLGFYQSPKEIIKKIESEPKWRSASEYFMLGTAYKNDKQYKKALFCFANSCFVSKRNLNIKLYPMPIYSFVTSGFNKKSAYYDDALYEIASIMFSYREYEYTGKFLKKISRDNIGLYFEAAQLEARALSAAGNNTDAEKLLSDKMASAPNDKIRIKLLIRRASVYEAMNESAKASGDYKSVMDMADSKSWQFGLAAGRFYLTADKKKLAEDEEQSLEAAKGLYFSRKYAEALSVLDALKKGKNEKKDNALTEYRLRCLMRLNKIKEADKFAESIADGKLIAADELWKAGKRERAVNIYKAFNTETALSRTLSFLIDRNRDAEAHINLYLKHFPNGENADKALWNLARYRLREKKNDESKNLLLRYLSDFPEGKYSDQCRFWLYKIYKEQADEKSAADMAVQLTAVNPDSPYTFLLLERIAGAFSEKELNERFRASLKKEPDTELFYHCLLTVKEKSIAERDKRTAKLNGRYKSRYSPIKTALDNAAAGKFKEAQLGLLGKYMAIGYTNGIERVADYLDEAQSEEKAAALACLGLKYGYPLYSVYYGQQLLKELNLKENIFLMPKTFIAMVLPRPFADEIKQSAERYKLDTESLYALMKAESIFNHRVKSSAGAVGLMQLMPATAKDIAKSLNRKQYDLQDPGDSISFGAYYLGWLNRYYKGNMIYMTAAYNAGAGNVNKWIDKMPGEDSDYFTEFTAFTETRYYILRTGKFLRQYLITSELHDK